MANEVKEGVLAIEKAKIMGDMKLQVNGLINVHIKHDYGSPNFEAYVLKM